MTEKKSDPTGAWKQEQSERVRALHQAGKIPARGWNKKERAEQSKRFAGKPKPQLTCPVCKYVGGGNAMKRWHFDNCRNR